MGRKTKYNVEQKIKACEEYLSGKKSANEIAQELNMSKNGSDKIRIWVKRYQQDGINGLEPRTKNATYIKVFKIKVIEEYKQGSSLNDLTVKYDIRSDNTILNWIKKYNRHEEIEDYIPRPEVYHMSRRKTTIEERKEIVEWCIEHDNNYKEITVKFNCSYTQVYQWVRKYSENGEEGLKDNRGHRKPEEALTDTEKLERELKKLQKRNEELERENILLKKLNSFDWRG